jgi:hypothetical protein
MVILQPVTWKIKLAYPVCRGEGILLSLTNYERVDLVTDDQPEIFKEGKRNKTTVNVLR